jgi:cbb3-type cytochrome oxidase maturation protein
MTAIYLLIAVSFLVAVAFLGAFVWSIRTGQYDDDYAPSVRMLKDNTRKASESQTSQESSK